MIKPYLWCINTLFIFAVAAALLIKQLKSTKYWNTFVSHCIDNITIGSVVFEVLVKYGKTTLHV